jgi:uncharacterized protein YdeI (YjbR/CyaY-like superfamily)
MPSSTHKGSPVLEFASAKEWRAWLSAHHADSSGVWLRFFKKDSGKKSFAYAAALDEALCYGWIDSQANAESADAYLQRFTPRRPKGVWSQRNVAHVERLTAAGRMRAAGLRQVAAAKLDGRWQAAYAPSATMAIPADFLAAVAKNKKAAAFLAGLSKADRYAIAWRLATAKKPETRAARFARLLAMVRRGEKIH